MAELPEELVRREMLTQLPIKSAARFKCVSKSWLSLFSDSKFVKRQLTRNTTRNPDDYDCLVANKHNGIIILSLYKETLALPSEHISLVGSVRGLVCLKVGNKFSLWNPAIHQSREFLMPPQRINCHFGLIGFGFDPVSDNYKVVVVSSDSRFASVYNSDSDDWIDISVPHNVFRRKKRNFVEGYITIVKDCPYWPFTEYAASDMYDMIVESSVTSLTLVKFDTGSNEFKVLPEFYFDTSERGETCAYTTKFVDMKDCLSLILYDRNSLKCMLDIYSLNGEEECCVWSKMYRIGPLDFIRPHWVVSQGFYNDEIVFYDHKIFSCYDRKTETIRHLGTNSKPVAYFSCYRYTPSLVFLKGMRSVHLTSQTRRTSGLCSRVPRRLISSLQN